MPILLNGLNGWVVGNDVYIFGGTGLALGDEGGWPNEIQHKISFMATGSVLLDLGNGIGYYRATMEQMYFSGFEIYEGSNFSDRIFGGSDNDTIYGLDGADFIATGDGENYVDGGDGVDTVTYFYAADGVTVDLAVAGEQYIGGGSSVWFDTLVSVENLVGSRYGDELSGDGGGNRLSGEAGGDVIDGRGGDDVIDGGQGADELHGGEGADRFVFEERDSGDVYLGAADVIRDFDGAEGDRIELADGLGHFVWDYSLYEDGRWVDAHVISWRLSDGWQDIVVVGSEDPGAYIETGWNVLI